MLLNCGVGRRLLRVPWTARRSNQSILKEIRPEYLLEGLMLKLKFQYFGHLMWRANSLEKTDAVKDWRQEEKGTTEDEVVGWHYRLNKLNEFEQAPGDGEGQGSLACCSPWGRKKSETTERLNNNFHESALYSNTRPQMFQANICPRKRSPEVFPCHWAIDCIPQTSFEYSCAKHLSYWTLLRRMRVDCHLRWLIWQYLWCLRNFNQTHWVPLRLVGREN